MSETFESLRDSFNLTLRVEGAADRTVVLYGQSITYFSRWLDGQGLPADLTSLTRDNVRGWLDSLRSRGLTDGTILTRWRGLRRFSLWLQAEGIVDSDSLANIKVEKPDSPPPEVFTNDELAAVIKACEGRTFVDRRDMAIVRLLLDCGLRVSELTGITTDDLDMAEGSVRVIGKGRRPRTAHFGDKTALALDRYKRVRSGHRHSSDPAWFLGERGPFSPDGVRERLKVRARQAGLDPAKMHPHRFRHTNAHDWLLAGGQERDLMRLLGWRSEAMLSRYGASAADQRAREAARRFKRGDRV